MVYGSVCSGIEAATCAWHGLGWTPAFLAEIDKSAASFLARKYPGVPNYGDMTKFKDWPDHAIDLLVGGTPCQSFSVAGLRKGMADPRGNLALVFLALADRYRPQWIVWENVPGVLSSNGGRDFGSFLGGLGQLGYGFAYRVLDAQYVRVESHPRAVPQRRRRVFVVGCLGDWRRAAAVLFERESLSGHPAPRREAGKAAPTVPSRRSAGGGLGTDFDCDGGLIADWPAEVASTLNAAFGDKQGLEDQHALSGAPLFVPAVTNALTNNNGQRNEVSDMINGLVVAFDTKGSQVQTDESGATPTLRSMSHDGSHQNGGGQLGVAFTQNQRDEVREMSIAGALAAEPGIKQQTYLATTMAVRRLTPLECTRLQGFPDDYFNVPGKPFADGPIYKMLGNSMAVNCMTWIGQRIDQVRRIAA